MKHAPRLTALLLILALLTGLLPAASAASQPAEPRIAADSAIVIDYAMKNLRFNVPLIIAAFITYAVLSMLGLSSVWITLLVVIIGMFVSRGVFMIQSKKTEK